MIRTPYFRNALGGGLVVATLALALPARAEDDSTTTAAARERFKEGVSYFDQKQYEKARAAFVQAYALKKHPAVLLNLAQSELRSNHERDAAQHFAQYLREATDASAPERDAAQAGLTSAKAAISEVTVVTDPDADVSVDGTLQGTAPLPGPVYLDPGSHSLQSKKGDRVATLNLIAKAGETREAKLKLATEATPATVAKPKPAETPYPATSPPDDDEPAPRRAAGREPFFHWLLTKPAGVISGGATVLFAGGAVGFAIAANVSYSDADDTKAQIDGRAREDGVDTKGICKDPLAVLGPGNEAEANRFKDACAHREDSVSKADSYKTVATVAGIGAGVMAVTTAVLYFVTAEQGPESASASRPNVAVLPWFGSGKGGVSVTGRF